VAGRVEHSLILFHGQRYDLGAWVVMPNHVHVLFAVTTTPCRRLLKAGIRALQEKRAG
jgi:REP element-mobilizing transposase RayT